MVRTCLIILLLMISPLQAMACDTSRILSALLGVQPDQVKWKVDLRNQCSVNSQGALGTCWANSGMEFYNQFFHRYELLPPGKKLSADYYAGKHLRDKLMSGYHSRYISDREGMEIESLHDFIFKHGLVFEDQFHFPVINGNNIRNVALKDEMYAELRQAEAFGASEKEFSKLLDHYLGDPNTVVAEKLNQALVESIRPKAFFGTGVTPAQIPGIEKMIAQSLDQKVPVQFSMLGYGKRVQAARDSYHIFAGSFNPADRGGHAMNIIGYRLDKNGKIDLYLIENSFGEKYGSKGTITIRASYLYERANAYVIAPLKENR